MIDEQPRVGDRSSCARKKTYRSKRHARNDARAMGDHYAQAYAVWFCTHHGGWHIGTVDRDRPKRRRRSGEGEA